VTDQSRRLAEVQAPVIPIVSRWMAETPGTISLGQGMVTYGPPPEAGDAVNAFGQSVDDHKYGPVEGLPPLVDLIGSKLERENDIDIRKGSRVVVTAGGNLAFMNTMLAITDPGDEVVLPAPFYFNHEMAVVMAGARVVTVPTRADYQLDVEAIGRAIGPRTRAVVTVSPNNPTGAVYPETDLRAVNRLCAERRIFHVHDEAYEYFLFDGARHFSPGCIEGAARHTISLFSLSKAYGMASWRLGYMVIPEQLWEAVNKIQDTLLICPPAISQHAALAALTVGREWTASHLGPIDRVRRRVLAGLTGNGLPCDAPVPTGALYLLLGVRTVFDAMTVTERLIREHGVAVVPGSAFGATGGCYLRVSFGALDEPTAIEAISRLAKGIRSVAAS
jgi:aspartate/methionine/tyrosine aminotransferase